MAYDYDTCFDADPELAQQDDYQRQRSRQLRNHPNPNDPDNPDWDDED